jgi:predicted RNA-binding Zn-ribbon protein involved in translation (DUF1610 family)
MEVLINIPDNLLNNEFGNLDIRIHKDESHIIQITTANLVTEFPYFKFLDFKVLQDEQMIKVLNKGIDALQRNIPKDVLFKWRRWIDFEIAYDVATCPTCGLDINKSEKTWESSFCPRCGQALKWEALKELKSKNIEKEIIRRENENSDH